MPIQDRAQAVSVMGKHFTDRFPDNRFNTDFVETLAKALEEVGVLSYGPPAVPAAAQATMAAAPATTAAPAAAPAAKA